MATTLSELIPIAIKVSMGIVVFAIGLDAQLSQASYLVRRPGLLARSVASMNVIMLIFAGVVVSLFDLRPAANVAIVVLALSPVPPFLPRVKFSDGTPRGYVISLLVTMAVLAIVVVPLGVDLTAKVFHPKAEMPVRPVASTVLITVIVPLIAGMILNRFAARFATRIGGVVARVGSALLVTALLPVLVAQRSLILSMIGDGTLLALAVFTLVGVTAGHILGGPVAAHRTVLALATGTRHPGVALAIAAAAFGDDKTVLALVLWHLVVGTAVSIPYLRARRRRAAARPGTAAP